MNKLLQASLISLIDKGNNFDIVRLVAALQVAFRHGAGHFATKLRSFFSLVDFRRQYLLSLVFQVS